MQWPDWLEAIKAKSPEFGGESLARHTWLVLEQLAALARQRPALPDSLGCADLWHRLFWACLLHDLGKAARGFQKRLRGGPSWPRRHEVLSLAFLDWALPPGVDDAADFPSARLWVIAAVVSHHRDAGDILKDYQAAPGESSPVPELLDSIPDESVRGIYRWLAECAPAWIEALGLTGVWMLPLPPTADDALARFRRDGAAAVQRALREYRRWTQNLEQAQPAEASVGGILLRGLITTADHVASAHAQARPPVDFDAEAVAQRIVEASPIPIRFYDHQRNWQPGSAILVAPTGSGKTEAALLWAAAQHRANHALPRLFYTLPYQASMNAMKHRLDRLFGAESVAVEHGRALLALYRIAAEKEGYTPQQAARAAREQRNHADLHLYPIKVFSPYQMLKAVYRLRGYEAMLLDYYGGAFVFDEIHAYDPARMALILSTIAYLRQHYAARFLVMTATLPPLLKAKLKEALGGDCADVRASEALFEQFRRHRLKLLPGEVLSETNLGRIIQDVRAGKSVLVCCNTVARAQDAYHLLKEHLPDLPRDRLILVHGRFNGRDRLAKEAHIQQAVGSHSDARQPVLLVATQVVEVSLDIDLDTIYTDPAPLEALLQRFGRVNRQRKQTDLADVHVCVEPADGQKVYDERMVGRTLDILNREADRPIDEAAVSDWLGEIYSGEIAEHWLREYTRHAREFQEVVLHDLRPFASDEGLTELFYQAFDGIEVLPSQLYDDYISLKEQEPIRASELLVPISWGRFKGLEGKGQAWQRDADTPPTVDADYSTEFGLQYRREERASDYGEE